MILGGMGVSYERGTPVGGEREFQQSHPRFGTGRSDFEGRVTNFKVCKDMFLKHGSSQGQNLALTVLFVPYSLDRGKPRSACAAARR